jgi:hypothetical protein
MLGCARSSGSLGGTYLAAIARLPCARVGGKFALDDVREVLGPSIQSGQLLLGSRGAVCQVLASLAGAFWRSAGRHFFRGVVCCHSMVCRTQQPTATAGGDDDGQLRRCCPCGDDETNLLSPLSEFEDSIEPSSSTGNAVANWGSGDGNCRLDLLRWPEQMGPA